jgi:predicted DNA binding CopG/RHH family protein
MKKKLPNFKSAEAEALFWEKHDILDYVDPAEFKIVEPKKSKNGLFLITDPPVKPKKILFSMRLEQDILSKIKRLAEKKKVNYQTMLREWIIKDYIHENKKKTGLR